jgi:riboflavin synthase
MFTGIVQSLGTLQSVVETGAGRRLSVALGDLANAPIALGDSVCVSGVCLTAMGLGGGVASFDVVKETLNRTTLGSKKPGSKVNLELSLRPHSYLGGHFVQGHVDSVATAIAVQEVASDWRIIFEASEGTAPYLVPKGSVTVDGVSMTIAEAAGDRFTLAVIPTTLQKTTLGVLQPGDSVNLETDILTRTVVHYLRNFLPNAQNSEPRTQNSVTIAQLRELGFA